MVKKVLFISVIFLFLGITVFLGMTGEPLVDAAAQLEQANAYLEAEEYKQAEGVYKEIVQNYPDSDEAMKAQKKLAVLYINWEKDLEARQSLNKLLNDFSNHPDVTESVWEVCDAYLGSAKYKKAGEFFQYFLKNRPQDKNSIWFKAYLIRVKIAFEDFPAVEVLFQEMLAEYSVDDALLADVLINIGHSYFYAEQHKKAHELYSQAMDTGPDELDEMWAVMGLGMSNAALGNNAEADSAVERLVTDFSDRADVAMAVLCIADAYLTLGEYEKAAELYRYISETWPDSEVAIDSQAGLAGASIALGDYSAAQTHIEKLFTDFSGDKRLASALKLVADSYLDVGDYQKANSLYISALDKGLGDEDAMWAQMGVAVSNIALSNEPNVENPNTVAAIDSIIADFNDHPDLPEAVFQIGEEYYNWAFGYENKGRGAEAEENFTKAIIVWERIIQELPSSDVFTPLAYYVAGDCYFQLGEYETAIKYCQVVADNWPDYEYAWHAQFLVGNYYERLRYAGLIPESEANPIIEQAYQVVIEKYPDCRKFKYASLKLAELNFEREQWTEAAMYYELFLTKFPETDYPSSILYSLGQAYDNIGEVNEAIRVYNEFLRRACPSDPRVESVRQRIEDLAVTDRLFSKGKGALTDAEMSSVYGGCKDCVYIAGSACTKPTAPGCYWFDPDPDNPWSVPACFGWTVSGYCLQSIKGCRSAPSGSCTSTTIACTRTYWTYDCIKTHMGGGYYQCLEDPMSQESHPCGGSRAWCS